MHPSLTRALGAAACFITLLCPMTDSLAQTAPDGAPKAPIAPQREHVSTYHGTAFKDPWFWLREKDTAPVLDYLKQENAYTEAMTQGIKPFADTLYQEFLGRIQQSDLGVPTRQGQWYYYSRTVQGQQYPIHARRRANAELGYDGQAPEEVLLDLNLLAQGKAFISLGAMKVSDDGRSLLYTLDETGYRLYKLYRKDLATGKVEGPLAERVTGAEWAADQRSLIYSTEHPVTKRSDTLWRLAPGAAPVRLYQEKDELFRLELSRTKDGRYLLLNLTSTDTWEVRLLEAKRPTAALQTVLPRRKGHKYSVEHREGLLYIRSNLGAKDFRVATAPVGRTSPEQWKTLVAHRPGVLVQDLELFKGHLVVSEKSEGLNRFRIHDFASGTWRELPFSEPVYAAVTGNTPEFTSTQFRYSYQSFLTPPSVYDFDMASGESKLLKQQAVLGRYDATLYASERVWATARDGTRVPLSIVYRRDRARDGKAPLWLYGYGAYGFGQAATFGSWRISLLDRGVAFAIAHVRGGNELGEAWHDEGMLMKKKNSFFDFIDSAEHLVKTGWTSPAGLMAEGGSAGGLLMGAVVNLRPDLFRAVHASVAFLDLVNTTMDPSLPLVVGEYLEWGDPNQKPAFDYIHSYSPYDNLERKAYPAMLLTSSYNDSQVMYWEPAKYVAKLRTLKTDNNPLLLKMRMEPAGHGGASGRYDALKDRAFQVAWMLNQVGVTR
ncbi:MAG: S9 family peptidase [Burkholderiales bacterium]